MLSQNGNYRLVCLYSYYNQIAAFINLLQLSFALNNNSYLFNFIKSYILLGFIYLLFIILYIFILIIKKNRAHFKTYLKGNYRYLFRQHQFIKVERMSFTNRWIVQTTKFHEKHNELTSTKKKEIMEPELIISQISDKEFKRLRQHEYLNNYVLNNNQKKTRYVLLHEFIKIGLEKAQLQVRTVQLALRMFDYFCFKTMIPNKKISKSKSKGKTSKSQGSGGIIYLDNIDQGRVALAACLFMCSKFNQVNATHIEEIIYLTHFIITSKQILKMEIHILRTLRSLSISSFFEWYGALLNQNLLPAIALQYYAKEVIFNAQNFAICFIYAHTMNDQNISSQDKQNQVKRLRQIYQQIDKYKKKVYQNDKSQPHQ